MLIGLVLAGFKELAGFSGEFLDSSESISPLGMPFPSEDNTSTRKKKDKGNKKKDKGNYLQQTYSSNTIKRSKIP